MKRTFKYIIGITCSLAAMFSCARFDEQIAPEKGKMEKVVFSAVIEGGEQTKTVLGGNMGDEYRKVLWQPEDSVGICSSDWWYSSLNKFVNTETEETEKASLAGEIDNGYGTYYAFYPYKENLLYQDQTTIRFNQPSVQTYRGNSFNANSMPMVARASRGEVFEFYSLCGVLAVNLTGTETVKSISFTGYDENGKPRPVAGQFYVNMGYETYPQTTYNVDVNGNATDVFTGVTLDCGEGVVLDPSNPTAFYIVLPVGTYNSFTLTVNTTDAKLMIKKGSNPLEIKRANVTKAGSLAFVEEVAFDLSEHGTANSYIVSEPGIYSFKANVIGNGGYGIIDGANFHTEDPFITPKTAELLWEDRTGVVTNITFDENRINFLTSDKEGNALIGVKDDNGTILWSWHIWVTDEPKEEVYVNSTGSYPMLDRNLGAIATYGETTDINGFVYQWGRKDPIRPDNYTVVSNKVSVELAAANPTIVYYSQYYSSHWHQGNNAKLWTKSQKTIYDPCPVGYKVPQREVWLSFSKNESYSSNWQYTNMTEFQYGLGAYFMYDGSNTTFYPVGTSIRDGQAWGNHGSWAEQWCAEASANEQAFHLEFNNEYGQYIDCSEWMNYALHVRCMKDNGHVDAAKPLVKIIGSKDITVDSATLEALVADEGLTSVTERGIIWGTDKDLSLENGNVVTAKDAGRGEFTIPLTGLQAATKYYYKAYAKNAEYTSYSETKYFYTLHDGNVYNLSQEGTANCYIVYQEGTYCFAAQKGNTSEVVNGAYAEVIWEVNQYRDSRSNKICNVSLENGLVKFDLVDFEPGNALLAVKDDNGKILWSWHIWIVEYEPSEEYDEYYTDGSSTPYKLMNRMLGASQSEPDYNNLSNSWELTAGMLYQWGRKEPLVYDLLDNFKDRFTSVQDAIENPLTLVTSGYYWTEPFDYSLWSSTEKTKYDPCPVGWILPSTSVFNALRHTQTYDPYGVMYNLSGKSIWFGYGDYIHASNAHYINNADGYIWATDKNNVETAAYSFHYYGGYETSSNWYVDAYPVRCMKEQKMESGDNEGYSGSDYEWE